MHRTDGAEGRRREDRGREWMHRTDGAEGRRRGIRVREWMHRTDGAEGRRREDRVREWMHRTDGAQGRRREIRVGEWMQAETQDHSAARMRRNSLNALRLCLFRYRSGYRSVALDGLDTGVACRDRFVSARSTKTSLPRSS